MFSESSSAALLQGLNPEQLSAVTWPPQSALVLAGAGSGKTRVLTTRIAWLLQTGQASVHSIMAVTFTNKAAKEMQTRLGAMIPINVRAMWLGTFHGLCHRFLRLHHRDAGLPSSFQILDSSDQLSLIKRLLKSLNIAEEIIAPRSLQGFINAQKESGLRASVLSAPDPHTSRMIECYAEYDKICQREGVVDFAELMLRSYEMLQSNEILRQHYQNRFNHILVDEFQDTNKLQYAWLKLMAGGNAAVFAVGDDDQSIYRFRGANVGNMTALMEEFHIDAPVKLEQNYRSVGNILAAATPSSKTTTNASAKTCAPMPKQATKSATTPPLPTSKKPNSSWTKPKPSNAKAGIWTKSPSSTAATPNRALSNKACSAAVFPTKSTVDCAFTNAKKSNTRLPTCALPSIPTTTTPSCA